MIKGKTKKTCMCLLLAVLIIISEGYIHVHAESTVEWTGNYSVECTVDKTFDLNLSVTDIDDFTCLSFEVIYNPAQLEATDLCTFTPQQESATGYIEGTNITITQFTQGISGLTYINHWVQVNYFLEVLII